MEWGAEDDDDDDDDLYDAAELDALFAQFGTPSTSPASPSSSDARARGASRAPGGAPHAADLSFLPESDGEYSLTGRLDDDSSEEEGEAARRSEERGRRAPPTSSSDPSSRAPAAVSDVYSARADEDDDSRRPAGSSQSTACAWARDSPASEIQVRSGPDYKRNGRKSASEESLYAFACLDVLVRARTKLHNVAAARRLPPVKAEVVSAARALGLPVHFVVNMQLPTKSPGVFYPNKDDPGVSLVFFFVLRERSALPSRDKPSVRLASRFFAGTATGRFKLIGFVDNLKTLGVPSFVPIGAFNGKPIIINKTGAYYFERDVCEVDVDVHHTLFPYLVRRSVVELRGKFVHAELRVAFVVQGETDDELPERLLGCCAFYGLDLDKARNV